MIEKIQKLYTEPISYDEAQAVLDEVTNRHFLQEYLIREESCKACGFVVPSKEMIELVNGYGKILEVGGGTGAIGKLLDDAIVTDPKVFGFTYEDHVLEMDANEAIETYPERAVLCIWPSYDEPWAYEMLKRMKAGRTLIYVGEGDGGCTADYNFHKHLNKHCEEVEYLSIPQWSRVHDYLTVYKVNVK